MGAILEGAELLKSPLGIAGLVAIIAALYFFVKWVMADDHEDS